MRHYKHIKAKPIELTEKALRDQDAVVIVTDHRAVDYNGLVATAPLIIDTRNAIKQECPHVFRLGAPRPAHAALWSAEGTLQAATSGSTAPSSPSSPSSPPGAVAS